MASIVSVIIPVYGVEKYLRQCLDTVIHQTYKELDIILVDDGSPDACPSICDEYKEKDQRITVIHKLNAGLGLARNSGLEIAKGEYIVFIDSDDWLELNYIERLVDTAKENESDMVVCGFFKCENGGNKKCDSFSYVETEISYDESQIVEEVLMPVLGAKPEAKNDIDHSMSVWTNLYSRKIIVDNKIAFVNEREFLSEDLFFNIHYIMSCNKITVIPDVLYNYRFNNQSLTNAYRTDRYQLLCKLFSYECKILKQYGLFERAYFRVCRTFIMKARRAIHIIVSVKELSYRQKIHELKCILESDLLQEVLTTYPIKLYRFSLKIPAILMQKKFARLLYIEEKVRDRIKTFI